MNNNIDWIYNSLEKYWWFSEFRWNQYSAIHNLYSWEDVVYVAKTGDWKSICYQLPATLTDDLTIVISPLKSLMKDQVESLLRKGIQATYINSDLEYDEQITRLNKLRNGEYSLLYVSPEKMNVESFKTLLLEELKQNIAYFIIDEFDTVDEYGSSWFRPEYLTLWKLYQELQNNQEKKIVRWIFTATAPKKVIDYVTDLMWIKDYKYYQGLLIWDNLRYQVKHFEKDDMKTAYFFSLIEEVNKRLKKEGWAWVIFCSTTKDVDSIYSTLKDKTWFKIVRYHWQLNIRFKDSAFKKFMSWEANLVVCTNAFWRGVDKSNIRYIIHYWVPSNMSSYLQEIGRWWRDGLKYNAITLFSNRDINTRNFLLSWWLNSDERRREFDLLLDLLTLENGCRTKLLEEYFLGEVKTTKCNQCDLCLRWNNEVEKVNLDELKTSSITMKKKTTRKRKTSSSSSTKKKSTTTKKKSVSKKRVVKKKG